MPNKSEAVEEIQKRFSNEWLLIAVDEMDDRTTTPRRGRLLAHSAQRDDIYAEMLRHKGLTFVTHGQPGKLPPGYRSALSSGIEFFPLVRISELTAMGHTVRNIEVACHSIPARLQTEGLLGLDFLQQFPPFQEFAAAVRRLSNS